MFDQITNPEIIYYVTNNHSPIPIKYQSRRRQHGSGISRGNLGISSRHLQKFLLFPQFQIKLLWFPLLKKWLKIGRKTKLCYVAIDRTRWKERNLFVAREIFFLTFQEKIVNWRSQFLRSAQITII